MVVTLSDDEESNHEFDSDQEGKFMAFNVIAVVDAFVEENVESPSDEELFENANLQETYNKLCKNAAKDAINANLSLKKIDILVLEKKNLLVKLFDANELINAIKIENMTSIERLRE